jgi:hypothetical protein
VIDHRDDRRRGLADLGRAHAETAQPHRVDLDRVDVLAKLVVQFARKMPALIFLRANARDRKLPVLLDGSGESCLTRGKLAQQPTARGRGATRTTRGRRR